MCLLNGATTKSPFIADELVAFLADVLSDVCVCRTGKRWVWWLWVVVGIYKGKKLQCGVVQHPYKNGPYVGNNTHTHTRANMG